MQVHLLCTYIDSFIHYTMYVHVDFDYTDFGLEWNMVVA